MAGRWRLLKKPHLSQIGLESGEIPDRDQFIIYGNGKARTARLKSQVHNRSIDGRQGEQLFQSASVPDSRATIGAPRGQPWPVLVESQSHRARLGKFFQRGAEFQIRKAENAN